MEKTKSKTNPLIFVGIGCLVLIVFLGIVSAVVGKFFAKKIGTSLIQGAIESKTGVKANLQDIENGKMEFTDTKTGETVNVGTGKIPDSFPKDFPVYPGATVVGSISGAGKDQGHIVTFSSKDSAEKVASFYDSALKAKGWEVESVTYGPMMALTIKKPGMEGAVQVTEDSSKQSETSIVVTLSEKSTEE